MTTSPQYLRKCGLTVVNGESGLDLSEMHIRFKTTNADVQSPNTAVIRVYNLAASTIKQIRGEFTRVVLQAGYENGAYGIIFDGTIKQFRVGKENATDTYLDILAADGDLGYNFGIINQTIAAGSSPAQRVAAATAAMGMQQGTTMAFTGGVLPRGKVLFGMARDVLRQEANTHLASWSIQQGKIQVIPLQGYLPGDAVEINALTGMIGIPEQTEEGVKVRKLLDPNILIGSLVKINNGDVNQLLKQSPDAAPIPYNQYAGVQLLADVTADGVYRAFVAEHSGDTRGNEWYSDLICLAVDPCAAIVVAKD